MSTQITRRQARKASPADLPGLVQTLARGFHDDRVFEWLFPDPVRRSEILPGFMTIAAEDALATGSLWSGADGAGAAVWTPPGAEQDEERGAAMVEAAGEYGGRVMEAVGLLEPHHPGEPHQYLFLLATLPERRSQGIGSALLRAVLEDCDRDRVPAYLEATSERGRALYERHGFEAVAEVRLPDGPRLYPMYRAPR